VGPRAVVKRNLMSLTGIEAKFLSGLTRRLLSILSELSRLFIKTMCKMQFLTYFPYFEKNRVGS
jgi:hypothetical protein